ncbi:MAG: transcriptional regulator FnrL [Tranquillimonas sp.]
MTGDRSIPACLACPIRHNAVCAQCDAAELAVLERAKSYRTYPAGAQIAFAGEPLRHFATIVSGCATLSRTLEDGRRQTVGLLLASDYIGRPGRAVSAYDVQAVSEVTLCRFERATFERLVRQTPHIAGRLLSMTLDELDAARDWAVVLGRMTARERVASILTSLVRRESARQGRSGTGAEAELVLPLTREALADHLGLTIETTSRQMTALRRDGLIQTPSPRQIRIPDTGRLARAAGEEPDASAAAL